MAKQPKMKQTDYNIGGHEISQTAIPYYKSNLTRMNDYLSDPQEKMDSYLNRYWTSNADQSDFLRNYNRAMGESTANNYNATSGGFSSANQRNYEDLQRYQNDLASRLNTQGVSQAYNMANQDYNNMLAANNAYGNAYGLGKAYSDVDQYNYIRNQQNGVMSTIGKGVSALSPLLAAIPVVGPALAVAGKFAGDSMTVGGDAGQMVFGNARSSGNTQNADQYYNAMKDAGNYVFQNTQTAGWFNNNNSGSSTPAGSALTNAIKNYTTADMAKNTWNAGNTGNLWSIKR